jgi:mRNA interferase HigB
MRIIAYKSLRVFCDRYPAASPAVERWYRAMRSLTPGSMSDIQRTFPTAKVVNGDRVRFQIAGGQYRLIAAFDLEKQIVFVKFIGTHAQYDAIDATTVSQFQR